MEAFLLKRSDLKHMNWYKEDQYTRGAGRKNADDVWGMAAAASK